MHEPHKVCHAVAASAATPLGLGASHVIEIAARGITIARAFCNDTTYFVVALKRDPVLAKRSVAAVTTGYSDQKQSLLLPAVTLCHTSTRYLLS
jgi:hypothetical protein